MACRKAESEICRINKMPPCQAGAAPVATRNQIHCWPDISCKKCEAEGAIGKCRNRYQQHRHVRGGRMRCHQVRDKGGIQGPHFAGTVIASTAPYEQKCAIVESLTIRLYTHRVKPLSDACFYSNSYRISGVGRRQFLEQQHAVHLHGLFAEGQHIGDLLGAITLRHQLQNLALTR